ncbi:MAG: sulfotransferase [Pseudomonadota bacterium]
MQTDIMQHIEGLARAGRLDEARAVAERVTREHPADVRGWLLLGTILMSLGRPVLAAEPLRKAYALAPGDRQIAERLYQSLLQAGVRLESMAQIHGAEQVYREAIRILPESIPAYVNLSRLLSTSGCYAEARSGLEQVLARHPGQPDACAALALSYEYEGNHVQAFEVLRDALHQTPVAPPIVLVYAALAKQLGEERQAIALLEEMLRSTVPGNARRDGHFALGRLYDACGDYERAFENFHAGNRLLNYQYDPGRTHATFTSIMRAFSPERQRVLPRSGVDSALPVFIVGMPRSGTTLVEQILASHPRMFGAGERDDIARLVHALGGPAPQPADLERLTGMRLAEAAQAYLATLAGFAPEAARIIDKMPHNFLALGYIDLLFPGCRVIHCTRDPRDTCLSIWFQQMTGNHPYTNDLDALADYYRQYLALMAHWKSVIRVPLLEVRYEDLVGDLERGAHELVDFCELEWDEQCLRYFENTRVVSTPTYHDVRQPIYDKSVGRWRNYERHLGALADLVAAPGV